MKTIYTIGRSAPFASFATKEAAEKELAFMKETLGQTGLVEKIDEIFITENLLVE